MGKPPLELLQNHKVLIQCEGKAEMVIAKKLIEADALIFSVDNLIEDPNSFELYTRRRSADHLEQSFLRFACPQIGGVGLVVAQIADKAVPLVPKRKEKLYRSVRAIDFLTKPEIEMLVIHREGAYKEWQRESRRNPQLRPSAFCVQKLGISDVKKEGFLMDYWTAASIKAAAIQHASNVQSLKDAYYLRDIITGT